MNTNQPNANRQPNVGPSLVEGRGTPASASAGLRRDESGGPTGVAKASPINIPKTAAAGVEAGPPWARLSTVHPSTPLRAGCLLFALLALSLLAAPVYAGDGTWINSSSDSTWGTAGNWSGNNIADGVGSTADFSTLSIAGTRKVSLDGNRTVGYLKFGDGSSPYNNWWINPSSGSLTLDVGSSSPTITVNNAQATIRCVVAGTKGLTVAAGAGTLWLQGTAVHTFTGGVKVNAGGTLYVDPSDYNIDSGATGTGANNIISNANSVTLYGGTFVGISVNVSRNQTVNGLTVDLGESTCWSYCYSGAANQMDLALGGITRNSSGTVLFNRQGGGNASSYGYTLTTANNDAAGILGPWAFYSEGTYGTYVPDKAYRYAYKSTDTRAGMGGNVIKGLAGTDRGNANSFASGENDNFNAATTLTGSKTAHTARYTGTSASTTTIDNNYTLTLNGLMNGGSSSGGTLSSGALTINANGNGAVVIGSTKELVVCAGVNAITIAAPIGDNGGGASGLTKAGVSNLTLSAVNTYTGDTWVNSGTLVLSAGAQLKFVIGANGVNNKIRGNGTLTLNGAFNFDLSGASTTPGNSWTIVDKSTLTVSFSGFSVNGFTDAGSGKWTTQSGGATFQFDTATGLLTVLTPPTITASDASHAFDGVIVGYTGTWFYTVSGVSLTNNITVTASPAVYKIATNGGTYGSTVILTTNASGAVPNTQINVHFVPTAVDSYPGTITNGGGAADKLVTLTGSGTSPQPQLDPANPTSLNFANVITNKASTNNYTLTGYYLTDNVTVTAPPPYLVATNTSQAFASSVILKTNSDASLNATVYVQFTPTSGQPYPGGITNISGALTQTVAVAGTGVVQSLYVGSESLAFGYVLTNTFSTTNPFTLWGTNLEADVTVAAPTAFTVSTNQTGTYGQSCTVTVAGASSSPSGTNLASQTIWVRFNPQSATPYSDTIICSSVGAGNATKTLTGTGVVQYITVKESGVALTDGVSTSDFASVAGTVKTYVVTNSGVVALTLTTITKDGANSGDFTVGGTLPTSLAVGGSTNFTVTFNPTANGARTAGLHIGNGAGDGSFDITLTGTGVATPPFLAFGGDVKTIITNYVGTSSQTVYGVHSFTNVGSAAFAPIQNLANVEYLVIGGGGAGGGGNGYWVGVGGGGAGGYRSSVAGSLSGGSSSAETPTNLVAGVNYVVTVGTGGIGASQANGGNGGSSSFGNITAYGGAGGYGSPDGANSGTFGSGGGGNYSGYTTGISGTTGQGTKGGNGRNDGGGYTGGGGGGGAGVAGADTVYYGGGSKGGDGLTNNITGSNIVYAGGGGGFGGTNYVTLSAAGGAGGGGAGRSGTEYPHPGTYYGAGGGGAGHNTDSTRQIGGNGYQGIVIVRYKFPRVLTVVSAYGGADPGTVTNADGTILTESITNSPVTLGATQYMCTGFTLASNAPTSWTSTNVTLGLTNDATLTWTWTTNYQLTLVTAGVSGGVDRVTGFYEINSNVVVTATASNHYHLVGWSGDTNNCTFGVNQITVPMTGPRTITNTFAIDQHTLTVVSDHGGANPAGPMIANYGTTITNSITNSPVTGTLTQYVCAGFTIAGNEPASGTGTNVTVTLTNDATLTWQWTTNYWLTLGTNGFGSVTPASGFYALGSNVAVTATPGAHYHFAGWSGETNGCSGLGGTVLTAAMTQVRSIFANFAIDRHTLTVDAGLGGGAVPGTVTNDYGAQFSEWITHALPTYGTTQYVSTGWTLSNNADTGGVYSANATNVTLALTNNATLTWLWSTNYYLALNTNGVGSVAPSSGFYALGSNVEVTATPGAHYHFAGWSGDTNGCSGLGGTVLTAAMTQVRSIVANFAIDQHTLTVQAGLGGGAAPGTVSNDYGTQVSEWITNALPTYGTTQYVSTGWTLSGNADTGGVYSLDATNVTLTITNDALLTWGWSTNYMLTLVTAGVSGGVDRATGFYAFDSNVVVTATASNHYHLAGWSGDTNGCTFGVDQITVPMGGPRTITNTFTIDRHTLTVQAGLGGGAVPGTVTNDYGTQVSEWITSALPVYGTTQYVSTGWTLSGNADTGGVYSLNATNVTLTITNDAELTWGWTTNYMLTLNTTGVGSVAPSSGFYALGSNVVVTATAGVAWSFKEWSGDTNGCTINGANLTTVPLTGPRAITANFAAYSGTIFKFR